MTDQPSNHPALERLLRLEQEWAGEIAWADEPAWSNDPGAVLEPTPAAPPRPPQMVSSRPTRLKPERPRMGYQPSLDGVRAVSVIAVILYHAGFPWMHGGYFGVEVFFVVSGFLITSLLIEERDRSRGVIALKQFWKRRFRRLLPALAAVLLAVGVWAALWGTAEQHTQLRRDYPWGIFYVANWGQIFSEQAYFSGTPTLFRHLWSLAVEEQWYAIWPLVFIAITRRGGSDRRRGLALVIASVVVMVATALSAMKDWPTRFPNPFRMSMQSVDPTNLHYLSTITRSSGLLLGAAMAFLWRPWRVSGTPKGKAASVLDISAVVAVALLVASFFVGKVDSDATYLWMLPMVSIASAVLVGVVVHPWATGARAVLGWRPLVEVGKRSYGLYLWSWPIMRVCDAYTGSWPKFAIAIAITVPVNEACYRWLEGPIRAGAISRWWENRQRTDWRGVTAIVAVSAVWLVGSMTYFFSSAAAVYDAAVDTGADLEFDAGAIASDSTGPDGTTPASTPDSTTPTESTTPTSTTQPTLPRKLVIVGDSTAHALKINLPAGLETTFLVGDGAISGCSVYTGGTAVSSTGYTRSFGSCGDWVQKWVSAAQAADAEVALVVIGAWDVFDVKLGGTTIPFDSEQVDQRFLDGLQQGIDALSAAGVKVALLEVPCMRPQEVQGQGTPPLPERADDARVAHVNELLREAAAANPDTTTFVAGPQEYCTDPAIATSLAYRWDGVHPYKPGAKLTIETIAAKLLSIPVG